MDARSGATPAGRRTALVLGGAMLSAAVLGSVARPKASAASAAAPRLQLQDIVPLRFGAWAELPAQRAQVVNPQTQQLLDKLYSQVLSRTYGHADGYRVMLSLAYGDDQRGSLQAHRPEACYPAQGFTLHSNAEASIATPYGRIPGRRLSTSLRQRREPVTYWFTAGDTVIRSRLQLRLLEARLWLTGQVPDGLLFRVSSIDDQPAQAFERHDAFVADLLQAVPVRDRTRLSGLGEPSVAPA